MKKLFLISVLLVISLIFILGIQFYRGYYLKKIDNLNWSRVPTNCVQQGTMCLPTQCLTQNNPNFSTCKSSGVLFKVINNYRIENVLCACEDNGCHFVINTENRCSVAIIG